jgi:hypothetical protein
MRHFLLHEPYAFPLRLNYVVSGMKKDTSSGNYCLFRKRPEYLPLRADNQHFTILNQDHERQKTSFILPEWTGSTKQESKWQESAFSSCLILSSTTQR